MMQGFGASFPENNLPEQISGPDPFIGAALPPETGCFISNDGETIEVTRTPYNQDFFLWQNDRWKIIHQGSALIVSLLECAIETERAVEVPPERGVRFLDTAGNFYGWVKLIDLEVEEIADNGTNKKHTAHFQLPNGKSMEVAIDDIQALGGSTLSAAQNSGQQM